MSSSPVNVVMSSSQSLELLPFAAYLFNLLRSSPGNLHGVSSRLSRSKRQMLTCELSDKRKLALAAFGPSLAILTLPLSRPPELPPLRCVPFSRASRRSLTSYAIRRGHLDGQSSPPPFAAARSDSLPQSFCQLMVAVFTVAVGGSVANVVLGTSSLLPPALS